MAKRKSKYKLVALDTNIFIYFFNRDSEFYEIADKLIKQLITDKVTIITTVLTHSELLSFKMPQEYLNKLDTEFLQMPKMELKDVTLEISRKAAAIRRTTSFKLVDSVQLATAIVTKAQVFITNDNRLKTFKEIEVLLLEEI